MIKHFKIGAEEVIANAEEDGEYWICKKPMTLVPIQTTGGDVSIAMMSWLLADPQGTIKIRKDVIYGEMVEVPEYLEKQYLERTSGISFATSVPDAGLAGLVR